MYTVKIPPTTNNLQKERQLQRALLSFPFLFSCQLAECKFRHHKEATSQICVKTRITHEMVEGTSMSGEGKQKHYYHVLGIIISLIQTAKVVNSKSERAGTFFWTTFQPKHLFT